ncbi:multidrug effflux MFS transporter [Tropicibacter naphthalenivorans]|uniref:Bcr/CflA family efflux transporter n=1 Tax=Tropicibacter naphthalenivorans TaxID=441103 RepID=A0A0P1G6V3_9RHOB|nr:multidrug effflux MFS transporter [Tropicibacter naphthalenivorans]CUH77463.1 Sulfonamide resistance protein [Tropicibacter naphthalenivorans]SMC57317.1 MFS transporter, DHA1 family, bicyclomycin/chloramphenicol resistance protein [Tropicibacter naphthalenivorans]
MTSQPSRGEFIAMIAMLFASIAFSIDAMLPALPELAGQFTPDDPNKAQLVVTSFVLGMGLGTLFTGPLSDAVGRKPIVLFGASLYIVTAYLATLAPDLETLLGARFVQGVGAAAPRVVALAIVRDLYAGRGMARIMSFVMMIFTLVPAIAPSLGALLINLSGWETIFYAFMFFSAVSALWLWVRLPETLPADNRRPFRVATMTAAMKEVVLHPVVRLCIFVQGLAFGTLFATISSIQPIYEVTFDKADSFPTYFAVIALLAMSASYLNSVLVVRIGMRKLVTVMLTAQLAISAVMVSLLAIGLPLNVLFVAFLFWQLSLFFQAGLTLGNLNAIAMEPMGHIAGMAASITGAISTVLAVVLAAPIGLMFDGTPMPLALSVLVLTFGALALMRLMNRIEDRLPA